MPIYNFLMFGCMGAQQATEVAAEGQGQSWWVILIYFYTIFVIINIPMFATGIVSASKTATCVPVESNELKKITKLKKSLLFFFILCVCIPVIGLVFFVLMLTTRAKIMRMRSEIPQQPAQDNSREFVNQAEAIKHFKELLDSGAITQEEFNAKKKEILG